jgi:ribosomal protein S21
MMTMNKRRGNNTIFNTKQAQLSPLQVKVRGNSREDFEQAARLFKSLVQKEKILALYKEKQKAEKPCQKKRRKQKEAREKRLAFEARQRLIDSGEWEKRMKKKEEQKKQRYLQRQQQPKETNE